MPETAMPQELKELLGLLPQVKTLIEKYKDESKLMGAASEETKAALTKLETRVTELGQQLDAADLKAAKNTFSPTAQEFKSGGEELIDNDLLKTAMAEEWRNCTQNNGMAVLKMGFKRFFEERKSLITTGAGLTQSTTGIQGITRVNSMVNLARQGLRVRDLLRVQKMPNGTGNSFDFVRQLARTNAVSPQIEGNLKAESTYTWDSVSDKCHTLAHWCNVTRQALDDVSWLRAEIDNELLYGLLLKEEQELLLGSGVGEHINGIYTQASSYAGTYNTAGDTKLDRLRKAKLEARLLGLATYAPDAIVLSPVDMMYIETIKEEPGGVANAGLYILGDPSQGTAIKTVWGLPVVESDSMTPGTFLLGAFGISAVLMDRETANIAISFENSNNFVTNTATIRAEERVGLAVTRPSSFLKGSFA